MNHMIKVLPDGRHQVYRVLMGHYTLPVGPKWETPRQAVDYANAIDGAPTTSPLRVPSEPSAPSPSVPSLAGLDLDGSDGPRERVAGTPPGE